MNKKTKLQAPSLKPEDKHLYSSFRLSALSLVFFISIVVSFASGCGPKYTYPSDKVSESIENICKKESKLDVSARVVGKTLGAVYYVDNLMDANGQIPKEVNEVMGKVMQAVTRVGLSTDLPVDFCVAVIRDRKSNNELIITRSLDDTKRANSDAIGIEESINRTLFGQGKFQDSGDEKSFVLKEVRLEDFLAEQVAQRVRFGMAKEPKQNDKKTEEGQAAQQPFILVDGVYNRTETGNKFRFSVLSLKTDEPHEVLLYVLRTLSTVLQGYKYTDYTELEILDYLNRQKLVIPKDAMLQYQSKKLPEQAVLDRYLTESQTIQEAFKLFGFNLSEGAAETEAGPAIAAAAPN